MSRQRMEKMAKDFKDFSETLKENCSVTLIDKGDHMWILADDGGPHRTRVFYQNFWYDDPIEEYELKLK